MPTRKISKSYHKIKSKTVNSWKTFQAFIQELRHEQKKIPVKPAPINEETIIQEVSISFSVASIAKATLVIIGLILLKDFLFEIKDIIIILFISLFFSTAIDSIVDKMEKIKIPRWAGVILVYLAILLVIIFVVSQIIPLVFEQLREIAERIQEYLINLYFNFVNDEIKIFFFPETWNTWLREFLQNMKLNQVIEYLTTNISNLQTYLKQVASGSLEALISAGSAVGGAAAIVAKFFFSLTIIIVLIFFMIVGKKNIGIFIISLFPYKYTPYLVNKFSAVQKKIGSWLNGTIILSTSMFLLSLIGLLIFQIDYAVTLALLTGVADVIPYLGPFIAFLAIVPVAINQDLFAFLGITIWFIGIQQIEANILVPLIMQKAVGLHPIVVLVSMLIGFQFLGILGIILAIPIATSLAIFVNDYILKNKIISPNQDKS